MTAVYAIVRYSSDSVVGRNGVLCFVEVEGYLFGENLLKEVARRLGGTVVRRGERNHVLVREDGEWKADTLRGAAQVIYENNTWFKVPVLKVETQVVA